MNKNKKLSHSYIQGLRPEKKIYRITDNEVEGLTLEITVSGSKLWRLRYKKNNGKYTMISLGKFPSISLSAARDIAREKKDMIAVGIDICVSSDKKFKTIFYEWYDKKKRQWSENYAQNMLSRVESNVLPVIGEKQISEINSTILIFVLEAIEKRGAIEMAHRCFRVCRKVFEYAQARQLIRHNPADDIKGSLTPLHTRPFPSPQNIKDIANVIKAIDTYSIQTQGSFVTQSALQLLSLTMLRPGEIRQGTWSQIYWDEAEWTVPAEKMKMRERHVVPLSHQAMVILRELQQRAGQSEYIFSSGYAKLSRPMSENTMNVALRRLDFSPDFIVSHSFRKIASTLLNERNWNRDWIERQLAHRDTNRIRDDYNYAQYLPQRRKMLQALADFYDYIKTADKPSINNLATWSED
jgi:integrase